MPPSNGTHAPEIGGVLFGSNRAVAGPRNPEKRCVFAAFRVVNSLGTHKSLQVRALANRERVGHADGMAVHATEPSTTPTACFDDLDLDRDEDRAEWQRRLNELATVRLATARERLERLGIIDTEGNLVSRELPPDMLPDSEATLETG